MSAETHSHQDHSGVHNAQHELGQGVEGHAPHSGQHDPGAHGHGGASQAHGHEDHGQGQGDDGHEERWGDYNSEPESPSTLPPTSAPALAVFAAALLILLATISYSSLFLRVQAEREPGQESQAAQPDE